MGELGDKVADMKKLFDQYASRDGKPDTLSKKELKQMIKDKMAPGLKGPKCPEKVDKIFERMDKSGDGEVDFAEFMEFVGSMASAVNGWHSKK